MAKFGFFDYTKPGPGVDKKAPKKHAFFEFFELWFNNIWSLISVNISYSLLVTFLLPCGLGSAGVTNVARSIVRGKHSFGMSDFWDTIKKNWKQALPAGIINILITALLAYGIAISVAVSLGSGATWCIYDFFLYEILHLATGYYL